MHRNSVFALSCLLLLASGPTVRAESLPATYRQGHDAIQERELRAWLEFLASNELAGRGTGETGYDLACRYIVSVLQSIGAEPGGPAHPSGAPRSWYQEFALVERSRAVDEARLVLTKKDAAREELALRGSFDVDAPGSIEWEGPLVFAGHGDGALRDERDELRHDDENAIFLVVPRGDADRRHVVRSARLSGAKRLLIVSQRRASRPRGLRSRRVPAYQLEPLYRLEPRSQVDGEETPEVIWISPPLADRLLSRFGTSCAEIERGRKAGLAPDAPRSLAELRIEARVPLVTKETPSRNVVALVPGSDPDLRSEAVVIGAHLDHVGRQGGVIHPGADDDGSGCAALLGVARALLANERRPRRTTILIFFGAEELGLHGSRYYSDHPTWPLERITAMFNIDMIGRNEERPAKDDDPGEKAEDNVRSVHVVGSKRASLELDPWVQRLATRVGLDLEYDEERVYRRSDHYNFARLGVPVAFFFAGFHPDYHKPTDTPEKLNWGKILRVTRLVFSLTFEIGDRPERLRVNRI